MNIRAALIGCSASFLMVLSNLGPLLDRALAIDSGDFFTRYFTDRYSSLLQPIDATESVRAGVTMALWGFFGLLVWWVWQNVSEVADMLRRYNILAKSSVQRGNASQQRALQRSLVRGLGIRLIGLLLIIGVMVLYITIVVPAANVLLARYVFFSDGPQWLAASLLFMFGVTYITALGLQVAWRFKHTETV